MNFPSKIGNFRQNETGQEYPSHTIGHYFSEMPASVLKYLSKFPFFLRLFLLLVCQNFIMLSCAVIIPAITISL